MHCQSCRPASRTRLLVMRPQRCRPATQVPFPVMCRRRCRPTPRGPLPVTRRQTHRPATRVSLPVMRCQRHHPVPQAPLPVMHCPATQALLSCRPALQALQSTTWCAAGVSAAPAPKATSGLQAGMNSTKYAAAGTRQAPTGSHPGRAVACGRDHSPVAKPTSPAPGTSAGSLVGACVRGTSWRKGAPREADAGLTDS